eukprot:Rmarinus@m.297
MADVEEQGPNQFSSFVKESEEIIDLVKKSCAAGRDGRADTASLDRICLTVKDYQEQSHLLDPLLEHTVTPFMLLIRELRDDTSKDEVIHAVLKTVCVFVTVRGYKVVSRFFPHEVCDLEPTLALLKRQSRDDYETWETRYVLLLWLSIIVLVPFDLKTIDSSLADSADSTKDGSSLEGEVIDSLLSHTRLFLSDSGKTRDAAGILLSRLLSRKDMASHLSEFVSWASRQLKDLEVSDVPSDMFLVVGIFHSLACLFKVAQRDVLLKFVLPVYHPVIKLAAEQKSDMMFLAVKLAQRLGLTFLKPRVAPWRYHRGCRSLLDNLKGVPGAASRTVVKSALLNEAEDECVVVAEEVEDLLDILLVGLKDKQTVVRWSSAKGIGRITGRLSLELADDIVGAVLELFSAAEEEDAWHGGCLALAELARRGLLLPSRLGEVLPVVVQALRYDVRKGAHSVGSHVRDAACYVCWAFARAYTPEDMSAHVATLAPALISMAVFDREVNCRRAAAAAFQENVGRQGNFENGIDIVTTADFFSLGSRENAYLVVGPAVARFALYRRPLMLEATSKLQHWDPAIRTLAARAVAALVPVDSDLLSTEILPTLVPLATSQDLAVRHGACWAVAELTLALSNHCNKQTEILSQDMWVQISELIPAIEKARLYRGRGGEIMRQAVCRLLECCSFASMPTKEKLRLQLLATISENLRHPKDYIQEAAREACHAFLRQYYSSPSEAIRVRVTDTFCKSVREDENPAAKRGYSLVLGALPSRFYTPPTRLAVVVDTLYSAVQVPENFDDRDAETRKNAVRALGELVSTLGVPHRPSSHIGDITGDYEPELPDDELQKVFSSLRLAMDDYCTDDRGDVGSWVREAAMEAFATIVPLVEVAQRQRQGEGLQGPLPSDWASTVVSLLAKQAVEKIDRVRNIAGSVLEKLLLDGYLKDAPSYEELKDIVCSRELGPTNWAASADTFPRLARLLTFDAYRYSLYCGFVISAGGLTESLMRHGGDCVVSYLKTSDGLVASCPVFLEVLANHEKQDRVVVPCLKTLKLAFERGAFAPLPKDDPFWCGLVERIRVELRGCGDVNKLLTGMQLLCLIAVEETPARDIALRCILVLLGHKFPKVRKDTAGEMVSTLFDVLSDEAYDILAGTRWGAGIASARAERDKLYDLLNVPKLETTTAVRAPIVKEKEDDLSYQALVKEMGY